MPIVTGMTAVTTGDYLACAIVSIGLLVCWGYNNNGQVGSGSSDSVITSAVQVQGLTSGVILVAAGSTHTCAVKLGGMMYC